MLTTTLWGRYHHYPPHCIEEDAKAQSHLSKASLLPGGRGRIWTWYLAPDPLTTSPCSDLSQAMFPRRWNPWVSSSHVKPPRTSSAGWIQQPLPRSIQPPSPPFKKAQPSRSKLSLTERQGGVVERMWPLALDKPELKYLGFRNYFVTLGKSLNFSRCQCPTAKGGYEKQIKQLYRNVNYILQSALEG